MKCCTRSTCPSSTRRRPRSRRRCAQCRPTPSRSPCGGAPAGPALLCRLRDRAAVSMAMSGAPGRPRDRRGRARVGCARAAPGPARPGPVRHHRRILYVRELGLATAPVDRGDASAAFLLRAPTVEQVRAVAEPVRVMPQKSTYFFPKLYSGFLTTRSTLDAHGLARLLPPGGGRRRDGPGRSADPRRPRARGRPRRGRRRHDDHGRPGRAGRGRPARGARTPAGSISGWCPRSWASERSARAGPWVVVVDPIDGSLNAKRRLPFYCLSIAFADGPTIADVRFGYVRDFGSGEEWVAEAGAGAIRGRPSAGRGAAQGPARHRRLRGHQRRACCNRRRPPRRKCRPDPHAGGAGAGDVPACRRPR